jgi:hypothetical protein
MRVLVFAFLVDKLCSSSYLLLPSSSSSSLGFGSQLRLGAETAEETE